MRIELRPVGRLRGEDQAATVAAITSVLAAAGDSPADLTRLRVVADWIQYKSSFREVADLRPILDRVSRDGGDEPGASQAALELAIDLRRSQGAKLREVVSGLLGATGEGQTSDGNGGDRAFPLEPWGPGTASCIWRFNSLYWQALSHWEQATGREYEKALPGGASDARNTAAVRELILELFKIWDDLDARSALPAELYVAELGVGNGAQAKVWLDEFVALSAAHSRDYYRRLHYLMGDYSPHVLSRARRAVASHGDHVTALVVDATRPADSLAFLRGKAFLVYISNVYDNLPTDEVARIGGRSYQVQQRAVLPAARARGIAESCAGTAAGLPDLIAKLLRLGPELLCDVLPQHFAEPSAAVGFWRQVWDALRLQERYVPIEGLDSYQIGPDLTGEMLRPQLETGGDIRVHVNNGALSSFADTLPLLHPFGRLTCHDLFVTDVSEYLTRFHGPGKYDGSVVNWVNGPLLRYVGGRAGFDVRITPFAQRPSANVKTLTAAVRE